MSFAVTAVAGWATLVAMVGLLAWMNLPFLALAIGITGAIFLLVFFSALQGIYVASLYRYATGGGQVAGFADDLLASAFVRKPA